jgi:propionate CoA-transferase
VVNLGIGMPEGVASVAAEERIIDLLTLTAEPGVIGGIPAGGLNFGAAVNPRPSSTSPTSSTSTTAAGWTSPSSGWRRPTPGQPQRQQVRPASGRRRRLHQHQPERAHGGVRRHLHRRRLEVRSTDRAPAIVHEGGARKFVREVEHRTFSGAEARGAGQRVLYVTERCVFRWCDPEGASALELIEIAPGIDLQRDVLAHMDFRPRISADLQADGRALFAIETDGPARAPAGPPAGRSAWGCSRWRRPARRRCGAACAAGSAGAAAPARTAPGNRPRPGSGLPG